MTSAPELSAPPIPAPIRLPPRLNPFLIDPFIILASSASAISARLLTHPLDTLRIRIQTYPGKFVPAWRELIPKPRARTLYAGLPVAVGFSVPALSIYLSTYEATKKYLAYEFLPPDSKPSLLAQLPIFVLSGMTAEAASGMIWTPMDVLKARMQKGNEGDRNLSARKLLGKIWREEGRNGVFRGYWIGMAVFVPYISLYWTLYESFKTTFIPNYSAYSPVLSAPSPSSTSPYSSSFEIPLTLKYTLCSITACALSTTLTNPIDLIQARWQTSAGKAGGVGEITRELWKQGGVRSFGRGLGVRVLFAVPANGISMTVYESLKRWKGI